MAKYADYVKGPQQLDNEIEDAAERSEERASRREKGFEVPGKFKGKSAEEIAQAYVELEKLNSRQAEDLGRMRKTVDDYVALQLQEKAQPSGEEATDRAVTVDDLYDDTEGNIAKVAQKAVGSRIEALETQLQKTEMERRYQKLNADYPGWQEKAQTDEFKAWVAEKPHRQRLAAEADKFDFDAAEELLGIYNDFEAKAEKAKKQQRKAKQLRDATLESGSATSVETHEEFSRADLLKARIAAKQGNLKAREWLRQHQTAIANAYAEGHITD